MHVDGPCVACICCHCCSCIVTIVRCLPPVLVLLFLTAIAVRHPGGCSWPRTTPTRCRATAQPTGGSSEQHLRPSARTPEETYPGWCCTPLSHKHMPTAEARLQSHSCVIHIPLASLQDTQPVIQSIAYWTEAVSCSSCCCRQQVLDLLRSQGTSSGLQSPPDAEAVELLWEECGLTLGQHLTRAAWERFMLQVRLGTAEAAHNMWGCRQMGRCRTEGTMLEQGSEVKMQKL